jgi:hypothetical protein
MPDLVVLGWSGCPTTGGVREWIARACDDAGLPQPSVEIEWVETDDEAQTRRFIGSPTFLVDGADLFPEPDAPPGLTCRLYRRADGRPSPLPDAARFAQVLGEALGAA